MERQRISFFLPNVFTGFNMGCGFVSMILACQGNPLGASMILILGGIFDLVDGRIARIMDAQSTFGEHFDSLSDMVSFGVAPAIIMYHYTLVDLGRLGIGIVFIYTLCTALRLARFNTNIDRVHSNFFQGLPAPCAAVAMAGYIFLGELIPNLGNLSIVSLMYTLFYSILMISNLPFYSFKQSTWAKEHKRALLVIIFLIIGVTFTYYKFMVATVAIVHVLVSFCYYIKNRGKFGGIFAWRGDN